MDPAIATDAGFGALLRAWRGARGHSQMALSLATGVSARHLSYLETGRASPSRAMVLALANTLDLPLRDRNEMLRAAGFAPMYRETPLDAPALEPVRRAVRLMLAAGEPNPAFLINRRYDVLDMNASGRWLLETFCAEPGRFLAGAVNMARLLVSPQGLRPFVVNWHEVAYKVLARIDRELGGAHVRDAADEALLAETTPVLAGLEAPAWASASAALPFLIGVRLRRESIALDLFTTIATLGTPLDVTLQELRVETLFPADEATQQRLAARAAAH